MSGLGGADDTPVCLTFIQDEYFGSYTENNVRVSSTLRLFCIIADRCQVSGIRCSILPKLAVSPLLPPVSRLSVIRCAQYASCPRSFVGVYCKLVVVCCGVVRTAAVVGLRLVLREGLHSSSCCSKRPQQQSMPAITPAADVFAIIVTVVRERSSLLHLN